jgi:branched-chain amino acid transport system permease protein
VPDGVAAPLEIGLPPALDEIGLPATGTEAALAEGGAVYWIFVSVGLIFAVAGWLLPWFVNLTSNGVGYSAQDAVSSSITGVGTILIYLVGVAMVANLVGSASDLLAVRFGIGTPFRLEKVRAILALAGAASTVAVWVLIGIYREEPLFGPLAKSASADNAIWLTLTAFLVLALANGFREHIGRHPDAFFAGVFLLFGALFPVIFSNAQATELVAWAAGAAAVYTLLALGLNVVVGFAGLLDLGYAAFFAIGAYTAASLASPRHGLHLPFWVIIFLAVAVAAMFGAALGAPTLRLRGDYLAIVTLGFGEIIPDMAKNNFEGQTGGPNGITGIYHPSIFGFDFGQNPRYYYWSLLFIISLVIVLFGNLQRSRLGRAWVAIREDEIAAAATGINTVTTKLLAFSIGASVSGLAGSFYGAQLGVVTPDDFEFAVSVTALTTVVLGGLGSNTGAALGGVMVSFIIFWVLPHLQEWMTTLGTTTGVTSLGTINYSDYTYIVYGLILISIMLLRPGGLMPTRARKVELQVGGQSESLAAVQGVV